MFGGKYKKSLKKTMYKKGKKSTKKSTKKTRVKKMGISNNNKVKKSRTMKKRGGGVATEVVRAALPAGLYVLQRLLNKPKNKREVKKIGKSIKRNLKTILQ